MRKALEMTRAQNQADGRDSSDVMVDGMSGFVFVNRYGNPTNQQVVMGHRNIQTTMDIYVEATEDKKQESFARLVGKIDVF